MRAVSQRFAVLLTMAVIASPLLAQSSRDQDAINRLIDRYGQLEDAGDMVAQAELMTADRIWIGQGAGRRTDQAMNMRLQLAGFDVQKEILPNVQWFTEARDRIIRFYGNGSVAVASFYWYRVFTLPADAPDDIVQNATQPQPLVFTLVLEKQGGEWKIVHTHNSQLGPPVGQ